MILESWVTRVEQQLLDAGLHFGHGTDNAFDEAAWLVMFAAGIKIGADPREWHQLLGNEQQSAVKALVQRRIETRRPLAYLVNQAWFAGYEFYIDERAIVPRSHIGEYIGERFQPWLGKNPVRKILDLCTGSGCLAIAVAMTFPTARVDAVDLSREALEVAAINVARYGLHSRVHILEGDLFEAVSETQYDLIVCNPPYVDDKLMNELSEEHRAEPRIALSGGEDGLDFIQCLLREARPYLTNYGALFVEAGSAADCVDETWPKVPFTWLSSISGESAVFTLTAAELDCYADQF